MAVVSHVLPLLFVMTGVYAPFPAGHPINFLNPVIEPVWNQLPQEAQGALYNTYIGFEPFIKAKIDLKDKHERARIADSHAWEAGKQLIGVKAKELKNALFGEEDVPTYSTEVEVKKDDHKGTDQYKGEEVNTVNRYLDPTQLQWETFQTAFQHAVYLRLAEKRALYQKAIERARLFSNTKKAGEKTMYKLMDKIEDKYLGSLEKLREKLYQLWLKKEEAKGTVEKGVKELMGDGETGYQEGYALPEEH